jgi:acylphosphatase
MEADFVTDMNSSTFLDYRPASGQSDGVQFDICYGVIHFSGRVQGVGFRYQTYQVAKEFEVTGLVRNLPDGRVLIEVEGKESVVKAFVLQVEKVMEGFIREKTEKYTQRVRQYPHFTIQQ